MNLSQLLSPPGGCLRSSRLITHPLPRRSDIGLQRFVPVYLLDKIKPKEMRKIIDHFLKQNQNMTNSSGLGTKTITALQAKVLYLSIIAKLPSYGGKCFRVNVGVRIEVQIIALTVNMSGFLY